ncbi:hypothetical protein I3I95_02180 [bacterium]|nr:hypothetical protein [bacterium]
MGQFNVTAFVDLARRINSDTAGVEVKMAAMGLPKDVVETISAFANRSGGVIVCGRADCRCFDSGDRAVPEALLR